MSGPILLRRVFAAVPAALLAALIVPTASAVPSGFVPSVTYRVTNEAGKVLRPSPSAWYKQKVVVRWSVEPKASETDGCELAVLLPFQTRGRTLTCTATWASQGLTITKKTVPPIKIDWTRPGSVRVRAGRPPDMYGWYGHQVSFLFTGRDALSGIDRCPDRVYRRPNDATASRTSFCRDRAGNVATRTVRFKYRKPLISPRRGLRTRRPPLLNWITVKKAGFYNIQLWHDGKVLSRFRHRSRFQVPRIWRQDGVRHRLRPGRYNVYVWPHFPRRYGRDALRTWFVKKR